MRLLRQARHQGGLIKAPLILSELRASLMLLVKLKNEVDVEKFYKLAKAKLSFSIRDD